MSGANSNCPGNTQAQHSKLPNPAVVEEQQDKLCTVDSGSCQQRRAQQPYHEGHQNTSGSVWPSWGTVNRQYVYVQHPRPPCQFSYGGMMYQPSVTRWNGKPVTGFVSDRGVNTHAMPAASYVPAMPYSSYSATQSLKKAKCDVDEKDFTEDEFPGDETVQHDPLLSDGGVIPREWEYTEYGRAHMRRPKDGVDLTVLSYNVLSQRLLEDNSYLYPHCSDDVLSWENRKTKLLQEIIDYQADVLCLQEVQEDHYTDFFLPQLSAAGYKATFQKRTGNKPDGCAIFVKSQSFEVVKAFPVIYNRGDILDRDNIALIVHLRAKGCSEKQEAEVFIATTHLLFNPRRGDVKLAQLSVLFSELDALATFKTAAATPTSYAPIVLCGDFNSEPHSDIYKFVVRGYLQYEGRVCRKLSGQRERTYGRDVYLSNQLLSPRMGITDQCQYIKHLEERNIPIPEYVSSYRTKNMIRSSETDTRNPNSECNEAKEISHDWASDSSGQNSPPSAGCTEAFQAHSEKRPRVSQGTGCLWHNLNFVSVYKHTIERLCHSTGEVTTQHDYASCTLDYIFYNVHKKRADTRRGRVVTRDLEEGKLRLLGRYGLLSSRELYALGGLPNRYLGSDHLGLIAKFLLKYS